MRAGRGSFLCAAAVISHRRRQSLLADGCCLVSSCLGSARCVCVDTNYGCTTEFGGSWGSCRALRAVHKWRTLPLMDGISGHACIRRRGNAKPGNVHDELCTMHVFVCGIWNRVASGRHAPRWPCPSTGLGPMHCCSVASTAHCGPGAACCSGVGGCLGGCAVPPTCPQAYVAAPPAPVCRCGCTCRTSTCRMCRGMGAGRAAGRPLAAPRPCCVVSAVCSPDCGYCKEGSWCGWHSYARRRSRLDEEATRVAQPADRRRPAR